MPFLALAARSAGVVVLAGRSGGLYRLAAVGGEEGEV